MENCPSFEAIVSQSRGLMAIGEVQRCVEVSSRSFYCLSGSISRVEEIGKVARHVEYRKETIYSISEQRLSIRGTRNEIANV